MRTTKSWVLLGLLVVLLTTTGFDMFSCDNGEYYLRPETTHMKAGQKQKFTVYYKTRSEPIGESSVDEFWWEVSGPAASTAKRVENNSAEWTAPTKPGQYTITARVITKNFSAELPVTVEGTGGGQPQEMSREIPAAKLTGTPVKIFEVGNVYGIKAGAKAPKFTLSKAATIVQIIDYHYLAGGGPAPGTIGLRGAGGTTYGPWQAKPGPTRSSTPTRGRGRRTPAPRAWASRP